MQTNSRWRSLRPAGLVAALLLLPACEAGLTDANIDSTRLRTVEPQFQLNDVILGSAPPTQSFRCEASIVQQHLRVFTGVGACGNFNVAARNNMEFHWNGGYGRLNELNDVLQATSGDPARQNMYNMARIMRAFTMMRITDTYGDVPYTEATQALDGVVFPAYDSQESIYTGPDGILEELKNASAALTASQAAPAEALYGGNVGRWQRMGNSLLLRAAMRLTKVNPTVAQQYVQAARNNPGGLMQSNADNAVIRHTNDYRSPIGNTMNSNEGFNEYLPIPFIEYLRDRDDPRLRAISVRYPTATSGGQQTAANAVITPGAQIGIPMGNDNNTIGSVVQTLGLPSVFAFSQTDRRRVYDVLAPSFLITYAQTQLLLADAAARWPSLGLGSPVSYFDNGVRAHMTQVSTEYINTAISTAEITAHLAANPLNLGGNVLEQINNEYWVASFAIPDEAWANFRRSCYPDLDPNPMTGDLVSEGFFRRFLYPETEISLNPNYASGTMPDIMDTRIWWDVDTGAARNC